MSSWSEVEWQALAGQGLVQRTRLRREQERALPPEPEPEPELPADAARERALAVIDSLALFQTLRRAKRRMVAAAMELAFFDAGTRVFSEGDAGDAMFILDSGTVRVTQLDMHSQAERELVVLGQGEYFGAASCAIRFSQPHVSSPS